VKTSTQKPKKGNMAGKQADYSLPIKIINEMIKKKKFERFKL
jgi:hypothetical protein